MDIRTPMEMAAGVLPGAHRFPEQSIKEHLATLPEDERVTVYDQTGEQGSIEARRMASRSGLGSRSTTSRAATPSGSSMARTSRHLGSHPGDGAVGDTHMAGSDEGQLLDRAADGSAWVWTAAGTIAIVSD